MGQKEYLKPPFGMTRVTEGYLKFGESELHLSVRLPRRPLKDVIISYDEIYDASYIPATKWLKGFLCVRDWKNRQIPLPRNFWEKSSADTIIWFDRKDNDVFYQAYAFLKKCAQINAEEK